MIAGPTLRGTLLLSSITACDARGVEPDDAEAESGQFFMPAFGSHPGRHAAALHLVQPSSPIVPWCSGVLVAPEVVVTASSCLAAGDAWTLGVGVGIPDRAVEYGIAEVVTMQSDPRVTALRLEGPVTEIEPTSIEIITADVCGVESVSYLHVAGDDPSRRWIWSGCLDVATSELSPRDGEPNCHGDAGAPVFSGDGGVVGIVVGARAGPICVEALELSVPRPGGPFEEAIALAR